MSGQPLHGEGAVEHQGQVAAANGGTEPGGQDGVWRAPGENNVISGNEHYVKQAVEI